MSKNIFIARGPYREAPGFSVGDFVKMVFKRRVTEPGKCDGERMWVRVTEEIGGKQYRGILDNTPVELEMQKGEEIIFHRSSVIGVIKR